MIRLGDRALGAAFAGDTPLARVYAGEEVVWERGRTYLTFSSPGAFTLRTNNNAVNWDGVLEYSTDAETWAAWDGTEIASGGGNRLYLRGTGNTYVSGTGGSPSTGYKYWTLSGADISCSGGVETLLDWETVAAGGHPEAAIRCFYMLFLHNACLISAPDLTLPEAPEQAYLQMFQETGITQPPRITTRVFGHACCVAMCRNTPIRISEAQGGIYQIPYRIPETGTGEAADGASIILEGMFIGTGGSFTGTPSINTTYYLSEE